MKLERIETPGISHFAYVLADGAQAAVIDPCRDVQPYLDCARRLDVRIRFIVETHRQEDFVMGSTHLAHRTGARIVNSGHPLFGHGDIPLADGESLQIGSIRLKVLATPGHTPESTSYLILEAPGADDSCGWGVFTGDTLFYGETGRTDLIDEEQTAENAGLLYDSVNGRLSGLDDTTLVLPAHGPGSVCGSGMLDLPWSTIGDEKRCNPVFRCSRAEFASLKAANPMPRPPYFRKMEKVNLQGGIPPVLHRGDPQLLSPTELASRAKDYVVIDTREPESFAGGHLPGSYSIWLEGLPAFAGWLARHAMPIVLVGRSSSMLDDAVGHLAGIGIDDVVGGLRGGFGAWRDAGLPIAFSGVTTPEQLRGQSDRGQILDVREVEEFKAGHISGAVNAYVGYLAQNPGSLSLNPQRPVTVTCSVGHRASLAVSILKRHGFSDVRNLLGGMTAWKAGGFPVEEGP
ncbi:MAG: MBL fold metallo-hydrolase [Burkholderiaceae bacterium]